jgi:hypothetical protein
MAVIVNIPNAHDDNSQWNASSGYWDINVRTNDGYSFVGDIKAVYNNTSGYPKSVVLEQNGAKVWAFGKLSDTRANTKITITGKTQSKNDLEVINNIPNTTEQHTYEGQTATFTVNGSYPKYRFKQPTVNYTGTDGQPKTIQMEVEVLERGSIATATVTDIDPTKPVTITGQYLYAIMIKPSLSNCYADPELPEHLFEGDTLSVVLKANPNTAFDDTDKIKIPVFSYQDEKGYYQSKPLTVSEDKQTATGQILLGDYQSMGVVAEAYPVTVVGNNTAQLTCIW